MKEQILETLGALRTYALSKNLQASFFYHEEDSYLMRFANSAISLNTNEHLIRLQITVFEDQRRAEFGMITDLTKLDEMKAGVDTAAEMVKHVQPLNYKPSIPHYTESFVDESCYDPGLGELTNEERLDFFNQAAAGLEADDIKLSGIFSNGVNIVATVTTSSAHTQYLKTSDAQINVVLSHPVLKWEVSADASAQRKSDLDPAAVRRDLSFLLEHYRHDTPQQLPLGPYDIVLGSAAIGDMVRFMNWIGFNGGSMKRGFSFLKEDQVGEKVFHDGFTMTDDPSRRETYPYKRDLFGIPRDQRPLFEKGVFKGFIWYQDDADEFGQEPTGSTVMHTSLVVDGGTMAVNTLEDLVNLPRDNDILYIPFLHYMNLVNPSKAVITGSSRFGALLLKKDGSVVVPFNVRLTQSLLDIFGDKVAWMSKAQTVVNTSMSYGARNPTAVVVPSFIRINGLEISHSNSSY